jgi:hypothetical protein
VKSIVKNKDSGESVKSGSGRRVFLRRFLGLLITAFCLWLVFVLIGRALRHIAIGQIAELTNTKIKTKSVDFNFDGSVVIKKLVISPYQEQKYDDAILKAERVYARFGLGSLLLLRPKLKTISVEDFVFDAQYDLNIRRWNVAALKIRAPKGGTEKMPVVFLERGTLQYSKVSDGKPEVVAAVSLDAGLGPAEKSQDGCSFYITTEKSAGPGKSTLTGSWQPGRFTITGGISSADIPAFEKLWTIEVLAAELKYKQDDSYSLNLKIEDLYGTEGIGGEKFAFERRAFLEKWSTFTALQRFFNQYRPRGQVDIDLKASGNLDRLSKSVLKGKVYCKDVSICDRKFPYMIEHLTGEMDFTERSFEVKNLIGGHNDVKLVLNGWSKDLGPNWQYQIRITSDNMALDNDLYDALNTEQKEFWSVFSPGGVAAINYRLYRRSQTDKGRVLAVKLLNAEAAYRRFPYPLKNLTGELFFDQETIVVSDLVSRVNEHKITFSGKVAQRNTDRPIYDVSIKADDIPLDSTLASALPAEQKRLYIDFDMTGLIDAEVKVFTPEQNARPLSFIADVSFKESSLTVPVFRNSNNKVESPKVNQLPLAVSDISGKAVLTPGLIRIEKLTGLYCESFVTLTGRIWPGGEAKKPGYCLSVGAVQVELNDDFIRVLPAAVEVPILQKGRKTLESIVSELHPKGKINLIANLNRRGRDDCPDYELMVDCLGNSVNFKPFPYPLKDVTGRLIITTDSIILKDITATTVDDIQERTNTSIVKLNGEIALADNATGNGWFLPSAGNISLTAESLKIKGKSLTELRADVDYDPDLQNWDIKNLIADCYGGRLAGKLELRRSAEAPPEYVLQVGFDNIDLKQFLSDTIHNSEFEIRGSKFKDYTRGRMSGSLSVRAAVGDKDWRMGRCRLAISDMQVGRLSPLVKLLQLKLTESEQFAFDRMLVDSYIENDRLFLKHVDLSGEDLAFTGSGWMDLQSKNVDLILFARGRRLATAEPSVLQSLAEGLGGAVVRMEITGNVYEPHVETRALPVIKDSLQILGTPR